MQSQQIFSMTDNKGKNSAGEVSRQTSFTKPPEWEDEDRMHFLLAPFPLDTSPSLQDPKLSFWSSLILSTCQELKKPYFTEEELKTRFKWNNTLCPSCLETVLQTMEKSGVLLKRDDFVKSSDPTGWLAWGLKVAVRPVGWALSSYLSKSKYSGQYVITTQLKEYAEHVIVQHKQTVVHKSTDLVMKVSDFNAVCSKQVPVDVIPLVKVSLSRDGLIATQHTELGYDVLKVCDGKATAVSEVDVGIVRIKETVRNLKEQVDSLEQRVQKLKQQAKENIKDKKRAIRFLRQSKILQGLLDKREVGLDNLETALQGIQAAETDALTFEAYKSSVSALKAVREGVSLEGVEQVMDDLMHIEQENQEITTALSTGLHIDYDEDELERDLATLLKPSGKDTGTKEDEREPTASSIADELEAQLAALHLDPPTAPLKESTEMKTDKKRTPTLAT